MQVIIPTRGFGKTKKMQEMMKMTIIKTEAKFSAAHVVHTTDTKCSRLHGHTWKVEVIIDGTIQEDGMVVDFIKIKEIIDYYDHKTIMPEECIIEDTIQGCYTFNINDKTYVIPKEDIILFDRPITAEHLAEYIKLLMGKQLKLSGGDFTVRVWESETSYAEA